jgi:uncharacterized repeat protein (TIGR02543 family)
MKARKVTSFYFFSLLLLASLLVSCPGALIDPSAYSEINYDGNGSDHGEAPPPHRSLPGSSLQIAQPGSLARTGHSFLEWNTEPFGSGSAFSAGVTIPVPPEDLTLYARWSPKPYTLSFSGNGNDYGDVPFPSVHPFGAAITALVPGTDFGRSGYTFRGWNSSEDGSGPGYAAGAIFSMPAHDLTLYAVWEPVIETDRFFTLSYDPNQGVGNMTSGTWPDGSVVVLDPNGYLRPDYYFAGWSDEPTGPVLYYNNADFLIAGADAILYAQWEPMKNNGEMLVRSGSYLFRIGGRDEYGVLRSRVLRAFVRSDGSIGPWALTTPLPVPLADGAAIVAGNMLYILGGITATGPSKNILYTQLKSDGTFYYAWISNTRSLPHPLAKATSILHDGRIFLIGGNDGVGERDSIIHARIYQDGQLGQWYESPAKLPYPLTSTSVATVGSFMVIAGGSTQGLPVNLGLRYTIGSHGLLTNEQSIPLPDTRTQGVLTADGTSLLFSGGYSGTSPDFGSFRLHDAASSTEWVSQEVSTPARILGPGYSKAYGRLFALDGKGNPGTVKPLDGNLLPDLASYYPGSGFVPATFTMRWESEPGTSILLNGVQVDTTSLSTTAPSIVTVGVGYTSGSGPMASAEISSYWKNPYPSGFLVDSLGISWRSLQTGVEVTIAEGRKTLLIQFNVSTPRVVRIASMMLEPVGDLQPSMDLFESELYTSVLDVNGLPLVMLPVGRIPQEERTGSIALGTGTYYLGIRFGQSLPETARIAISFSEETL